MLVSSSLAWMYAFSVALVALIQPKLADSTHVCLGGCFGAIAGFFCAAPPMAAAGLLQAGFFSALAEMQPELVDDTVTALPSLLSMLGVDGLANTILN